jgi:hypothetical protein
MTWISMPYAAFYFGINEYVKKQNGYSNIFIHHCPGHGLEQAQTCGGFKPVKGFQIFSF